MPVDKSFLQDVVPFQPSQTSLRLSVYTTSKDTVTYCDDPGTELLGTLVIVSTGRAQRYDKTDYEFYVYSCSLNVCESHFFSQ